MKKYFDIKTPVKKMNGWDRSLLELTRMMNVGLRNDTATYSRPNRKGTKTRGTKKNERSTIY